MNQKYLYQCNTCNEYSVVALWVGNSLYGAAVKDMLLFSLLEICRLMFLAWLSQH